MEHELPAHYKAAIQQAVSAEEILIIGNNKKCKLVSVDFEKGHIKCLPLFTNNKVAEIYETVRIQDILKNDYKLVEGGSKSRKHLSRKRKGKKSYRKNKYSKTKKSRKFRRSIRDRR